MAKKNNRRFHCVSEVQKKAIRKSYAEKSAKEKRRIEAAYPHFRFYRKSKHPALIVGEQKSTKQTVQGVKEVDEYRYRKVMHGEKDGRHLNEVVYPNPNPKDDKPMYIAKRVRHDDKENFENAPLPWKYPKK